MSRVLLLATTTGYQTRMFGEAAARLGVELVFATDRCQVLDDPWRDGAVAVRFHDEAASLRPIVEAAGTRPFDGILALGDRPTVLAAMVAASLGLPGHPVEAARAASSKHLSRIRFAAAGLPGPWFRRIRIDADPAVETVGLSFPCVVKPLALSASRGVMRADDPPGFHAAFARLRRLLLAPDVRAMHDPACDDILVEGFIEGPEFALEGILEAGRLQILALFDKPDPLDGPFFEETIYVTPSSLPAAEREAVVRAVEAAVAALGLRHGPVHAECRINDRGVFVLEVAARPIGGLCARALRFTGPAPSPIPLEELLLRHATGESVAAFTREVRASAVMMIPIPRAGVFRRVEGLDEALAVPDVEEIRITAKTDERLVPLPEGSSYLGFVFARAAEPADAAAALRAAHERLRFVVDPPLPVVGDGESARPRVGRARPGRGQG